MNILFLIAFIASAFAQDIVEKDGVRWYIPAMAHCDSVVPDDGTAAAGERFKNCYYNFLRELEAAQLEALADQQVHFAKELLKMKGVVQQNSADIEELDARVTELEQQAIQPPQPGPVATTAQPQVARQVVPVTPAWQVVRPPSVVSIYPLQAERDTLHITHLDSKEGRDRCAGEGDRFVMFTDHGEPMSVTAPAGARFTGFVTVYYDRDGNGTPDGQVKVLDLNTQDDVYLTWNNQSDLGVHYMVTTELWVDGVGYVPMVRKPRRDEDHMGVVRCGRDQHAQPGGRQVIRASQLAYSRGPRS